MSRSDLIRRLGRKLGFFSEEDNRDVVKQELLYERSAFEGFTSFYC